MSFDRDTCNQVVSPLLCLLTNVLMRRRLATVRAEIVRRGRINRRGGVAERPFNHRAKVWRRVSRPNRPSADDSIAAMLVRLSSVVYGCDVSTGLRRDLDLSLREGDAPSAEPRSVRVLFVVVSFIRYGVASTSSFVTLLLGFERRGIPPVDRDCDPSLRAVSSHQASYKHRWYIRKRI